MEVAVDIGETEVRRLKRSESIAPGIHRLAKKPERMRIVVDYGPPELARQSGQVDEIASAQKLVTAARRNGDAALIATKALGFEIPARGSVQLTHRHPEIVTLRQGVLDGHGLI